MTNKEAKRAFMSVALVSMHDAYEALEDADTVDEAAKNKDNVLTIFINGHWDNFFHYRGFMTAARLCNERAEKEGEHKQ